jgi:hypothetical protein
MLLSRKIQGIGWARLITLAQKNEHAVDKLEFPVE